MPVKLEHTAGDCPEQVPVVVTSGQVGPPVVWKMRTGMPAVVLMTLTLSCPLPSVYVAGTLIGVADPSLTLIVQPLELVSTAPSLGTLTMKASICVPPSAPSVHVV